MATLQDLKSALRSKTVVKTTPSKQTLSDTQYDNGFKILLQGSTGYQEFIIPQLSQVLAPLFDSRSQISALEIGPGPKSVLGGLPAHQRRKIQRYEAFEPNQLFAASLEGWLSVDTVMGSRFPRLERPPTIHRLPFDPQQNMKSDSSGEMVDEDRGYDMILFCHSMYGMQSKRKTIEQAIEMLEERRGGMVLVFHRDESLRLDGLVCHQTATFPTGVVRVADEDHILDDFTPFIAGFAMHDENVQKTVQTQWRKVCRALGRREDSYPGYLTFRSPDVMVAFNQHATKLSELTAQLPAIKTDRQIKNREAHLRRPAAICRPTEIYHIQLCVRWAVKCAVGLTIIGGGHSGHCIWENVISVDMSAFNQVYIHGKEEEYLPGNSGSSAFIVVEAGCTSGDVIRKAMAEGVTVPLGSRPSVGAGLWLQGGIGHLARLHGLACDAIVGAVMVSVDSGQVLCLGYVPREHQPAISVRAENETEILWGLKGAGTNLGIIVSVTFRAYTAPVYVVRNWVVPVSGGLEAQLKLGRFDELIARKLSRNCSADAYLYWEDSQLYLGFTMIESTTASAVSKCSFSTTVGSYLGAEEDEVKVVDNIGLFETEMYLSKIHGGHGRGKTSSFKRCLFMKEIGNPKVAERLVAAMEARPSSLCYLHLLQGGEAISDIAAEATAFGCRDWHFACVITGVWFRNQDCTEVARAAVEWVYNVADDLLPLSSGAYCADLGPDPRDAALASRAFGVNWQQLVQLKNRLDPRNVLAYACQIPKPPLGPKLILLVTGESCAGKDYCADVWVSMFEERALTARAVSISEAIKREYAVATGADPDRLLSDRDYKEQHRPALTAYFMEKVQHQPWLPEEQFMRVVHGAADVGVLVITGMRDKAPVAALSHLVPNSKLLEVYVQASEQMRRFRKGRDHVDINCAHNKMIEPVELHREALSYRPSAVFDNEMHGNEAARNFFEDKLLPLVHEDLLRLADMVPPAPNFPHENVTFRHVLGISQQPNGLALCTSLLQSHFIGDWSNVAAVACCEVGGIVFASALSLRVNVPLILIREAGKLPPPTISAVKSQSHVSSLIRGSSEQKRIEIERRAVPKNGGIVVIDDTLASGETLCAVLQILKDTGVGAESMSAMVVAELPIHRGRELLCRRGFSGVSVQSLLTFGGV
jgi:adenine/guanine phosphoribosyltransferase-like PRPP-binding protein